MPEDKFKQYLLDKKKWESHYNKDLAPIEDWKTNFLKENPDSSFVGQKDIPLSSGLINRGLYINQGGIPTQVKQFNINPVSRPKLEADTLNPIIPSINNQERGLRTPSNLNPIENKPDSIPFTKFTTGQYNTPNAPYGEYMDEGKRVNVTKDEASKMGFIRKNGGFMSGYSKSKKYYSPDQKDYEYLKGVGSSGIQGYYDQGGDLKDYYNTQLTKDENLAKGLLSTGLGAVGSIFGGPVGGAIGSTLGTGIGSFFNRGGGMTTERNPYIDIDYKRQHDGSNNLITEIPKTAGTHESNPNNGVNISNYDSSVEGNETIDNKNKFVFSDRLSPNGSKRTYASLTKPLNKKLDFRKGDKLTQEYVQIEMDKLAEDQEAQKHLMDIMDQAHKLYGGIMSMGGEMKDGGWIKGAINPEHKGYCTPMTKETCTPHRKAFAMRAKAHFKDLGGSLYPDGGKLGSKKKDPYQEELDAYRQKHPWEFNPDGTTKIAEDQTLNRGTNPAGNFNEPLPKGSEIQRREPMELMKPISMAGTSANTKLRTDTKPLQKIEESGLTNPTSSKSFKGSKAIPFAQLLGPASQMLTSLTQRNNDLSRLNYRTPEFTPIDETYAANLAQQGQDRIAATTANAIRGTANDQGTYLAALLASNSAMLGSPNQPSNLAYDAMKTNVAGRNTNSMQVAGIKNQNIDEREKLLDNSREEFTNALYNAGATSGGIYRDINQPKQDKVNNDIFTKNFGNVFSNLELNPDGTIKVKKVSKYGGKMKKC